MFIRTFDEHNIVFIYLYYIDGIFVKWNW